MRGMKFAALIALAVIVLILLFIFAKGEHPEKDGYLKAPTTQENAETVRKVYQRIGR